MNNSRLKRIRRCLDKHVILAKDEHHIIFGRPDSGSFLAHFTPTTRGFTITGDGPTACFMHSSCNTLEQRIRWIGESGSMSYVAEKWAIGMGFSAYEWNKDTAEADARQMLKDREADGEPESIEEHLREAISCALDDNEGGFYEALSDANIDDLGCIGTRIRTRILQSYAVCHALVLALNERMT